MCSLRKSLNIISLAAGAAGLVAVSAIEASAQQYQRTGSERQRYQITPRMPQQAYARPPVRQHAAATASQKPAQTAAKPPASAPKAPPPLTEEQIAAKAAIDDMLSRDPALAALKERPDPALVRAAAARHSAQEQKIAALKAKDEADAAKRRQAEDKNRAREEANAALKAKQDPRARGKTKAEAGKPAVVQAKPQPQPVAEVAAITPAEPIRRMPTP